MNEPIFEIVYTLIGFVVNTAYLFMRLEDEDISLTKIILICILSWLWPAFLLIMICFLGDKIIIRKSPRK